MLRQDVYKYEDIPGVQDSEESASNSNSISQSDLQSIIMHLSVLASAILALVNGALALPANAPTLDVALTQVATL